MILFLVKVYLNLWFLLTRRFDGTRFFSKEILTDCSNEDSQLLPVGDGASVVLADDDTLGFPEMSTAFKASHGVQCDLLPVGWIANHFRWIVWKLAGLEQCYPDRFGGVALTPDEVMRQLKYR